MKNEEFINWINSLKKSTALPNKLQRSAKASLKKNGLPHKRLEGWRVSNLNRFKSIFNLPIAEQKHSELIKISLNKILNTNNLPDGIEILTEDEIDHSYFNELDQLGDNKSLINTLNDSTNNSIVGLKVKSNNTVSLDLIITNIEKELAPTKIIIVVENYSQLDILQVINGAQSSAHSHLIEIHLNENSTVNHDFVAIGKESSSLLGTINIKQRRNSNYSLVSFQEGWNLSRLEKEIIQLDGNAKTTIKSLSVAKNNQELATHTSVKFSGPNGHLEQLNKAIVDNDAHYIFNGLIEVPQIAQKTQASQLSKNLILSSNGRINTSPQLKIIADDVKCNHGATISQLEDDQIFYLQSRGINKDQANSLLVKGFCKEITNNIQFRNNNHSYLSDYLVQSQKR